VTAAARQPTGLRPITLREGRAFIAKHHRHSAAPLAWICGVGLEQDGELVAVACLERPKALALCDGYTAEISRVCTLGAPNACSRLYSAMARAAKGLGYRRVVTYTLATEPGASPKASGFRAVACVSPEDWNRRRLAAGANQPDMFRKKYGEPVDRVRWERQLA
jgi:hypothetical protein